MRPTVGRIVHYQKELGAKPWAGIVSLVHSDTCVTMTVFPPWGPPEVRSSVVQWPDERALQADRPEHQPTNTWRWPPQA